MTTKKTDTTDPRTAADAAVATWRAIAPSTNDEAAAKVANLETAAREAVNAFGDNTLKLELEIKTLAARIAFYEAEDAERAARFHAALALEAVEPEDPTDRELLGLCGVRQLRDRLAESLALEARLRTEIEEIMRSRQAMASEAREAHGKLTARRGAAGLPAPLPIPADPGTAEQFLAVLSKPSPPPPPANQEAMKWLRADEVKLRANAERARRSKADAAKQSKKQSSSAYDDAASVAKQNADNIAVWNAEEAAVRAEEIALAAAHRKGAA